MLNFISEAILCEDIQNSDFRPRNQKVYHLVKLVHLYLLGIPNNFNDLQDRIFSSRFSIIFMALFKFSVFLLVFFLQAYDVHGQRTGINDMQQQHHPYGTTVQQQSPRLNERPEYVTTTAGKCQQVSFDVSCRTIYSI